MCRELFVVRGVCVSHVRGQTLLCGHESVSHGKEFGCTHMCKRKFVHAWVYVVVNAYPQIFLCARVSRSLCTTFAHGTQARTCARRRAHPRQGTALLSPAPQLESFRGGRFIPRNLLEFGTETGLPKRRRESGGAIVQIQWRVSDSQC